MRVDIVTTMPFVEEARREFEFLVRDFDFVGPRVETGRAYISLSYLGRRVGVSVEFDAREETVDVVLARLVDGEFPLRYEPGWVYLDRVAEVVGRPTEAGAGAKTGSRPSEAETYARIHHQAVLLREVSRHVLQGDGSQLERFQLRYQQEGPPTEG